MREFRIEVVGQVVDFVFAGERRRGYVMHGEFCEGAFKGYCVRDGDCEYGGIFEQADGTFAAQVLTFA